MSRRRPSRSLVVQGRGAAPGLACGRLLRPGVEAARAAGGILLTRRPTAAELERVLAAAGTISLGGAVLSHAALLCRERGRPMIVLGEATRARLLEAADAADGPCLELGDLVGAGPTAPRLAIGDVVVIDGSLGELRVPGGVDPQARAPFRSALDALVALGHGDAEAAARLVELARPDPRAIVPFAVEAGFECGIVPEVSRLQDLVVALRSSGRGSILDNALRSSGVRALARGRHLAGLARARVAELADPDEVDLTISRAEASLARERALLVAAGLETAALDAARADLGAAGTERLATLRRDLRAAVDDALATSEAAAARRVAELARLARRAASVDPRSEAVRRLEHRVSTLRASLRSDLDRRLVVPLPDDGETPGRGRIGGKAAGVARIADALPLRCRVPGGFVVTTDGYRLHLLTGPGERLREIVAAEPDDATLSRRARSAILGAPVPDEVADAVRDHATALGAERLAVRSSAPFEDAARSSLAGAYDTDLGVRGDAMAVERIRWTWASLWSPRSVALVGAWLRATPDAAMAVLVQRMIPTRVGGVMSTRDPGQAPGLALVNAWWGLGAAIADGELDGDLVWIRRDGGATVAAEPGRASTKLVPDPDGRGTVAVELTPDEHGRPCLDDTRLARLAELAATVETVRGPNLEIEFGFDDADVLYVFQCRPVAFGTPPTPAVGAPGPAR